MRLNNDIFARITEDLVQSENGRHIGGWFYKEELLHIIKCAKNTLEIYEKEGITNEYIDRIDRDALEEEKCKWECLRRECKKEKCKKEDSLYLIKDTYNDRLKIGRSINPQKRIKQLQTSNSGSLEILFIVNGRGHEEESLHRKFNELRICGEWFVNDDTIIEYFKNTYGTSL